MTEIPTKEPGICTREVKRRKPPVRRRSDNPRHHHYMGRTDRSGDVWAVNSVIYGFLITGIVSLSLSIQSYSTKIPPLQFIYIYSP